MQRDDLEGIVADQWFEDWVVTRKMEIDYSKGEVLVLI